MTTAKKPPALPPPSPSPAPVEPEKNEPEKTPTERIRRSDLRCQSAFDSAVLSQDATIRAARAVKDDSGKFKLRDVEKKALDQAFQAACGEACCARAAGHDGPDVEEEGLEAEGDEGSEEDEE